MPKTKVTVIPEGTSYYDATVKRKEDGSAVIMTKEKKEVVLPAGSFEEIAVKTYERKAGAAVR